jgi:hypothetical protein
MQMPPEDIEGMHKLLDEWTVRDALTVLDEVGRRIKVIEALEKVMGDPKVDELHVIHPLVTQARWLFGPEYESPTYASNVSIRNAVQKVFGQKVKPEAFENPKKRPDLLFLPDSTLSAVATEDIDLASGISRLRVVLLIELKKGGSAIGREEMNQANGYIQDILACGLVDGAPHVVSFVVGHELSKGLIDYQEVGKPAQGTIQAMTFGQLVRTANARLFRVRDQVQERYAEQGAALVEWLAGRPAQMSLLGLIERPAPVQPIATVADPAPFRRITGAEVRPFANCVPIYDDLKIAAGPWSEERVIDSVPEIGEIPNPDDYAWVELPTGIMPDRRLFVARVIGESMNKRIPNGAWCLWRRHQGGEDRIGKVVLVQHRDIQDEGLGAEFTVKVYDAESMSPGGEGAREQLLGVALKPDSEDPSFTRIVLEGLQENELRVLAELVEVLL